jgi:hypothetical protein
VWDAVRDVGAVHRRLLPGRVLDADVDGDVRTLVMPDGHVVRELIVDVNDETRRLAYAVIDGARPALRHHHASLQVFAEATATAASSGSRTSCRAAWRARSVPGQSAAPMR